MLHPNVLKSLEKFRAVFQIAPGWQDTYTGWLAKTEVPNPFKSEHGPVSPGQLAVRFTSRTAGARLIRESIPESLLEVYHPTKKNSYCMVIKGLEGGGGESIGSVLNVTNASTKEQKVTVQCLDGTPANEATLPFSRVIVVELVV